MIIIHDYDISVSKGDAVNLSYSFINDDETDFNLTPDDRAIFTVKKNTVSVNEVLRKEVHGNGSNNIDFLISSSELNCLQAGCYVYDIRIITVDGVTTPFTPAKFNVLEVVGNAN